MSKSETQEFTSYFGIQLIESGLFDEDTFEQYSPREIQLLSNSTRQGSPIDLTELYENFIEKVPAKTKNQRFIKNCSYFAKSLGLNSKANALIEFIVISMLRPPVFSFVKQFTVKSFQSYSDVLSLLLGLNEVELEEYLDTLESIGLYKNRKLDYELPILPWSLANYLFTSPSYKTKDALVLFLKNLEPARYELNSFGYNEIGHIKKLIEGWKRSSDKPINILIHGAIGTGKTELAKSLCSTLNLVLMSVSSSYEEKERIGGFSNTKSSSSNRIQNLSMARRLSGRRRDIVLLIDECEDIFDVNAFGASESKEMLHGLIEKTSSATIWITNHVDTLPDSCTRRFDYVFAMPELTKEKRLEHASAYFNSLILSQGFIDKMITNKHLSLANIGKASHGANLCRYKGQKAEEFIESYLEGVMIASGIPINELSYKPEFEFNHDNINLKGSFSNLNDIVNALNSNHGARTLLFGPAGTGKTAFVNYVCEQAGFELITVQASDILSKWVGESEQNISKLFKRATNEGAAIFIDEADSLFASRESATNSWEVQLVNQLLFNLEMYELPFFAATNFKKRLDKALLRRCDFKLELDYLTPEQVSIMILKLTGKKTLDKSESAKLVGLDRITPGDFSVIARKMRFLNKAPTSSEVLEFLFEEQKLKGDCKRRIGF